MSSQEKDPFPSFPKMSNSTQIGREQSGVGTPHAPFVSPRDGQDSDPLREGKGSWVTSVASPGLGLGSRGATVVPTHQGRPHVGGDDLHPAHTPHPRSQLSGLCPILLSLCRKHTGSQGFSSSPMCTCGTEIN